MDAWLKWSLIVAAAFIAAIIIRSLAIRYADSRMDAMLQAAIDRDKARVVLRDPDYAALAADAHKAGVLGKGRDAEVTSDEIAKMPPNLGGIDNPQYRGPDYFGRGRDHYIREHGAAEPRRVSGDSNTPWNGPGIDPIQRCPGCGITVFANSDATDGYCGSCKPRPLRRANRDRKPS